MNDRSPIPRSPFLGALKAYAPPRHPAPIDLGLGTNEGPPPPPSVVAAAGALDVEAVRTYPDPGAVERLIAERFGIDPAGVLLTAGADDAIERAIRAVLAPGRTAVVPVPTFEMIPRYTQISGCDTVTVPWLEAAFPLAAVLDACDETTTFVSVVTPNSPTGFVATRDDIERLSAARPSTLLMVDLAYTDYADEDLTAAALALPNVVVTRTMSKAWGLAGLRVGWAAGPPELIGWLRAAGHPYAVSAPSLAMAAERLNAADGARERHVAAVREERERLRERLVELGCEVNPSQGNFVLARTPRSLWLRDALAGLGIGVRVWPGAEGLEDAVRITLPGDEAKYARLEAAVAAALAPEALILDIDDTMVDVGASYRGATIATAAQYGIELGFEDITAAKAAGDANNDWELTRKLLADRGVEASLAEVTERFEALYQGTDGKPGLKATETPLVDRALLIRLKNRYRLAIVTGRPRSDAEDFLGAQGFEGLFEAVVTMDDGPLKPDPAPVRRALELLGVTRAWMVGDTPDDVRAARAAGVVPLGVVAPSDDPAVATEALGAAGAARVLTRTTEIEELLS